MQGGVYAMQRRWVGRQERVQGALQDLISIVDVGSRRLSTNCDSHPHAPLPTYDPSPAATDMHAIVGMTLALLPQIWGNVLDGSCLRTPAGDQGGGGDAGGESDACGGNAQEE